jgi:hypothetical protein
MSVVAAAAALVVTAGVAQASPDDSDDNWPPLGIPLLGDGAPGACAVTSSDPKRPQNCNEEGGDGRDGDDGARHGHPSKSHHSVRKVRRFGQAPDVNGAPGGRGVPRARVAPGADVPDRQQDADAEGGDYWARSESYGAADSD